MPLQATSGAASYDAFGGGVAVVPTFIEDIFSCFLYTGNDSTQTITNGIDLADKGGLVWLKRRTSVGGTAGHRLYDTNRGAYAYLQSNATAAESSFNPNLLSAFLSTGFTLGSEASENGSGDTYCSWTFRKQPKFFDIQTWTGTGSNTTISHSLGSVPACIMVKRTDTTGDWQVYHRSLANTEYLVLNSTAAKATGATRWNSTTPTSTVFSLGTDATVNASGGTYVAYLFAHDAGGFGLTGTDNVISCGSYTGNGNNTIELGYEPQWIMVRRTNTAGNDWEIYDTMRDCSLTGSKVLVANSSAAEGVGGGIYPTATGFYNSSFGSGTIIYIAIRRGPMKVPTSGTSVYNGITRTATNSVANINGVGFPPDICISSARSAVNGSTWFDKLRGPLQAIRSPATTAEATHTNTLTSFNMDGISVGAGETFFDINRPLGSPYVLNFMRRAPSFFDEVCYLGNNVSGRTITHNLAAVPELMIVKSRTSSTRDWMVYDATNGATKAMNLNNDSVTSSSSVWASTAPTSTVFTVSDSASVNDPAQNYVAYLFATCAGVSKCGTFTGNGSSQTINCGFTGGARFVMVKATSTTGDWMVADSARGIVSGNDPYLELNNTNAEVTGEDWLDTDSTGFVVNEVSGSNANTNGVTYIFLAIA